MLDRDVQSMGLLGIGQLLLGTTMMKHSNSANCEDLGKSCYHMAASRGLAEEVAILSGNIHSYWQSEEPLESKLWQLVCMAGDSLSQQRGRVLLRYE